MTEKEKARQWVQTWQEYEPALEKIRLREVRAADNVLSLRLLARSIKRTVKTRESIIGPCGDADPLGEPAQENVINLLDVAPPWRS